MTKSAASKECKADADVVAQVQKDKTLFQVFFTQIAGADDAADLIELLNDVVMYFTIPSDMVIEMVRAQNTTRTTIYSMIAHPLNTYIGVRED